ncbi:MAG: hypothetical protein Q7S71_05445 [Candidatus Nitrotoga sp.]|nr:hypothetical protein [Candidatus Nitrotoga sp.]
MDNTSPTPPKNIESTLHEAIDKFADKEMDVIAVLADGSHKTVESLAYRAAQLEDTYHQLLSKSRSCIQSSPFKCLGIAIVVSFVMGKLLNRPRDSF